MSTATGGLDIADYVNKDTDDNDSTDDKATQGDVEYVKIDGVPESVIKTFDGKPIEEVLRSYANLQRRFSEQGKELGDNRSKMSEMRGALDSLIQVQSQRSDTNTNTQTKQDDKPAEPVTSDDLYEDPEGSIEKVVKKSTKETDDRLQNVEAALLTVQQERVLSQIESEHEDWKEVMGTDEFKNFVQSNPINQRIGLMATQQLNADAAIYLLDSYKQFQTVNANTQQDTQTDTEDTDTDKSTQTDTNIVSLTAPTNVANPRQGKTFSRTEIVNKKAAALRGNSEAKEWLDINQAGINEAYASGNLTD